MGHVFGFFFFFVCYLFQKAIFFFKPNLRYFGTRLIILAHVSKFCSSFDVSLSCLGNLIYQYSGSVSYKLDINIPGKTLITERSRRT